MPGDAATLSAALDAASGQTTGPTSKDNTNMHDHREVTFLMADSQSENSKLA